MSSYQCSNSVSIDNLVMLWRYFRLYESSQSISIEMNNHDDNDLQFAQHDQIGGLAWSVVQSPLF